MNTNTMKNVLIGFVLFVLIFKSGFFSIFSDKNISAGGFTVPRIEGWEMKKETDADDMETVTFLYPPMDHIKEEDIDPYNPPEYSAMISFTGGKLSAPIWIEDQFPEIVGSIMQAGYTIIDKGEIKIDDELSKWALYEKANAAEDDPVIMSMYSAPDSGYFYKLEILAKPDVFNKFKPIFDAEVQAFKMKKGLF